jgi:hypothetical protein
LKTLEKGRFLRVFENGVKLSPPLRHYHFDDSIHSLRWRVLRALLCARAEFPRGPLLVANSCQVLEPGSDYFDTRVSF